MGRGKRHNHVVPEAYLRRFANEHGLVSTSFSDTNQPSRDLPIGEVGVRKSIYLTDPDEHGIRGRQLEELFSDIESDALPLLEMLEHQWPVSDGLARSKIAEYLAIQHLRTPAWLRDLDRNYRTWSAAYQGPDWVPAHVVEAVRQNAPRRENQFEAAMNLRATIGTMFASMRWTLLRTSSPMIATSDQPLVAVPFDPEIPTGPILRAGIKSIEEVRLPLSCDRVLLLDWYAALEAHRPVAIPREAARTINAATIDQADVHWFHRPKREPPRSRPLQRLISPYAIQGYDSRIAFESERRSRVLEAVEKLLQSDSPRSQISILTASARAH